MSQRFGLGLFLLSTIAFGMDVESLPVWDPAVLVRGEQYVVRNASETSVDTTSRKDSLETHGYKTMQITVGDGGTQVDQELKLSIQGKLADSVYVDALLSDVGRKAGDQTTATLRDVDQIYFRVESPHAFLHLGDLKWTDESMGLYSMERSSLGAMVGARGEFLGGKSKATAVYGTDEVQHFTRTMNGVSGQRSGYSMDETGSFISVVPESETVWLNGRKLRRGVDYVANYAGGMLDFKGALVPSFDDEIRIEYDAYDNDKVFTLYGVSAGFHHPNLYLDFAGFRLQSDADSLKNGSMNQRFGSRIQVQGNRQFYADIEVSMNQQDSSSKEKRISSERGSAFRWFATTDSTQNLKHFPVSFSVGGNRIHKEFNVLENPGQQMDWNTFRLRDEWDLDLNDSALLNSDLAYDEFALRMRLAGGWSLGTSWGYRRNEGENWNSSKANISLTHKNKQASSELNLNRIASFNEYEMERYQAVLKSEMNKGMVRPFGLMDLRYTEICFDHDEKNVFYGKSNSGLGVFFSRGEIRESVGGRIALQKNGAGASDSWRDSLKVATWNQEAVYDSRNFSASHMLQYERIVRDSSGAENSWVGDLNAKFGNENMGFHGTLNYKLGLTEEQIYTAVYKAVAPGTGDVRYDSLTGTYIEGVDNGDFVYEGQGRNDSIGAVRGSDASFAMDFRWSPGVMLGAKKGLLRDISLGGTIFSEGNDTTGKKLYFPPMTKSQLKDVTSGKFSIEGLLDWEHPKGYGLSYRPSLEYDKKLSSISYYERILSHNVDGSFRINVSHHIGATVLIQNEELSALQTWNWNVYDGTLKYRLDFMDGFFAQPLGRYRKGVGDDGSSSDFEADLWEGALRVGYNRQKKVNAYANFSVINVDKEGSTTPYQVMSGYNEGTTYRLELSVSLDLNNFISLGCNYVLRFGDAEENIFQKLSTEARANF